MKRIEAVIFDWAGTTVDYGCMAPVYAMQTAFAKQQVSVTLDDIRKPMGMLKIDHIKAILNMDHVQVAFKKAHGRAYEEADVNTIYQHFEAGIFADLHRYTHLIAGILPVQTYLRARQIKIGSTTGYTKAMIDIVAAGAKQQGYQPDNIVAADQVLRGRPYPYMLQQNLAALDVQRVQEVVKVGDTIVDIQEGLHAGCWSVGVIKGSSLLGYGEDEIAELPAKTLEQKMREAKYQMLAAGAHYVIDSIDELPWVIDVIENRINQAAL